MTPLQEAVTIAQPDLEQVRRLYEDGYYLRAYELARSFGSLRHWKGTEARILAARLAMQLGARRLGVTQIARAWHADRSDPNACYYYATAMGQYRSPWHTWKFLKQVGLLETAPERIRSDWLALHASILGALRDFDAAESWLEKAEQQAGDRSWLAVERGHLYALEDRYEDALAVTRQALELRPWYRPAVQATAHLLQLLDRDAEAIDLLTEAAERVEAGALFAQLAALELELHRYTDARQNLDRYAALSPLMERDAKRWLAGRRSDVAYHCGDIAGAVAFARASEEPFFVALADRLEQKEGESRRVLLAVPFVRQHHQTCAPATLTAIARFWGKSADHLEVAGAICYDGTPDHRERAWAQDHGWIAREFTVTWDAAVALLDRGIPFTLTTVETQSGHLQAVIGYDARRGTLLIRDPTLPHSGEFTAEPFFERYRSVGPRGMAMLPRECPELLEGIVLPDAALYDHLHLVQVALRAHDRNRAAGACEALEHAAPGQRLALHARRLLAIYDADPSQILATTEALLALFPDDANLRLSQIASLHELGRRDQRLALYRELCAAPTAAPLFRRQYAQELVADARDHATVTRLLHRVLQSRPVDAQAFRLLANVAWDATRREEALELYRFAACLGDKDEGLSQSYFIAARYFHQEEDALRFLGGRFRRFGAKSEQPARTLFRAYSELERMSEAFEMLDEAQRLRPEDGDLMLFAAESHAAHGAFEVAHARLESARGHCRRGSWLRTAAFVASLQGDFSGALAHSREVLENEPSAVDANEAIAQRLAETEGRRAAIEHLEAACERFPHNCALHRARIGWLRAEGPVRTEAAVRQLLEIHPADAWARRELAIALSDQGRHDEAVTEVRLASELEPNSVTEASARAVVLERAGRRAEAMEAHRDAIRRSADSDFDIARLMELCDSRAERIEALSFIENELKSQVIFGDGLLAFARRARGTLEPDDVLATLRKAHEVRPDLWHAWSALMVELAEHEHIDEAYEIAQEAVARFPLLPRMWLDLASVHQARKDREGQIEALRRALQINPGWSTPARALSQALEAEGLYEESRVILERATRHAPLDGYNHGCLADALWHLDQKEQAVERLKRALQLMPEYEWAWNTLQRWSQELDRPALPLEVARELTVSRGGEASTWLALADLLNEGEQLEEKLAALDRAIALNPRDLTAYDQKAKALANVGRFEEALLACGPGPWGDHHPVRLRGRGAWVRSVQGDTSGAITEMRAAVEQDPDYYWGWYNLADWYRASEAMAEYLNACEAMVRIAPDHAMALGYRGEARQLSKDIAGAKADYQRALELSPEYDFAAMSLFDLELEQKELEAAGRTIEHLRTHSSGLFTIAREVQYAAAIGAQQSALEALLRLCQVSPLTSSWALQAAHEAMTNAGWAADAVKVYETALERPDVDLQIAETWVSQQMSLGRSRIERRIDELLRRGNAGHRVLHAYLGRLGRARNLPGLRRCLRRYGRALQQTTRGWGMTGYALTVLSRYKDAASRMRDWNDRPRVEPWMLQNLVLALRALRRDDEAHRASLRALELTPDYSTPLHLTWVALEALLAGEIDDASEYLSRIDQGSLDDVHRYVFQISRIALEAELAGAEAREQAFRTCRRELSRLSRQTQILPDDYPAARQTYRRVVAHVARRQPGLASRLWRMTRHWHEPRERRTAP